MGCPANGGCSTALGGPACADTIQVIHLGDALYPDRLKRVLGTAAPPILATWGNLRLLEAPAVGWCGSRNASAQGIGFHRKPP